MQLPLVIIHGWSDESESFIPLAKHLQATLNTQPFIIKLGDWISRQDDVSFPDLVEALDAEWDRQKLPRDKGSVNVVTHSTGALIVRDWMTKKFTPLTNPIKRHLMLAPANFGSPLAHKGRTFIGRVLKGWDTPDFQTGNAVLKGLELASPYSYELAGRDLFSDSVWYGAGNVLATVLVGNTGYKGISSIANEDGSDGTVRISTANLNCSRLKLVLDPAQKPIEFIQSKSKGNIAFAIIDGENHSTIACKGSGKNLTANGITPALITAALQVTDADFVDKDAKFPWQTRLDEISDSESTKSPRFMNMVTHVSDNLSAPVLDYFFEFYRQSGNDYRFEEALYDKFIASVHPYGDNPSYRSLYLNINALEKISSRFSNFDNLFMSIAASPVFNPPGTPVGYLSLAANSPGGVIIKAEDIPHFFKPHQTMLVDVCIKRMIDREVFKFVDPA